MRSDSTLAFLDVQGLQQFEHRVVAQLIAAAIDDGAAGS